MNIQLFPGQGSQFKGMGKTLFEAFPDVAQQASKILGYDIVELCVVDPNNQLGHTQFTQPALYVVNALCWMRQQQEGKALPSYALGHSLGEYNALHAAGVFDFETGLRLVQKRGELMAQASDGAMAAVIGIDAVALSDALCKHGLTTVDLANFNSSKQTVISGKADDIGRAIKVLEQNEARALPLNVSSAFHSRYMAPAAEAFNAFVHQFEFKQPQFPVIANVTARPYQHAEIAQRLVEQIVGSVQWVDSIRYLMGQPEQLSFTEVNGAILTRMVRDIQKHCEPIPTEHAPEDNASIIAAAPSPLDATALGASTFKQRYNLKYAYMAGAMYKGVASTRLVEAMANASMLSSLGIGGLSLEEAESQILALKQNLAATATYAVNLLHNMAEPEQEAATVQMLIRNKVTLVEASAFMQVTSALAHYRISGLSKADDGAVVCRHRVIGKCSRPEVAQALMQPVPKRIVDKLLAVGAITSEQAELAELVPVADDITVEADSGGHTDSGMPAVLLPAIIRIRDRIQAAQAYKAPIHIGLGGGIGTPEAALAAFVMGADYIVTGSINQCTIESGASDVVKNMLNTMAVQDTDYAPAGDLFEMGAKVQVLKRGVFFPARANKLYQLYNQYDSLEAIPEEIASQLQQRYFKQSFDDVWQGVQTYLANSGKPLQIEKAQANPKLKMALVFKAYFALSNRLAMAGDESRKVDFQIHTGPALGAFNQWLQRSDLEHWQKRSAPEVGRCLLEATAELLKASMARML